MSISDELERLAELRRNGTLSNEEFEVAKRNVLRGSDNDSHSDHLELITSQNQVEQLDREWELERENYMLSNSQGRRIIPDKVSSVIGGVAIVVFGIMWTGFAAMGGPFFQLFGVIFVLAGAWVSIHAFFKADEYQEAYSKYKRKRRELISKQKKS